MSKRNLGMMRDPFSETFPFGDIAEAQKANSKLTHDEFITMWEDAIRAAMP